MTAPSSRRSQPSALLGIHYWGKEGSLRTPTGGHAALDSFGIGSELLTKLGNAAWDSTNNNLDISPRVPRLLFLCRPLAIILGITKRIVLALQGEILVALSHVLQKVFKGVEPSVTNRDAATAVQVVGVGVRVSTSSFHCRPRTVSSTSGLSVRNSFYLCEFCGQTATRSSATRSQALIGGDFTLSAIAKAKAQVSFAGVFWKFLNDFKPSKCLTYERYFLGHGIGVFNVVFSGGRPATTGAHCVSITPQIFS